jgi:membrane protease YdiL (CAAX protease family)
MAELAGDSSKKPRWRRIVDYPLVAMLVAAVLYFAATALGIAVGKFVPAQIGRNWVAIVHAALVIVPVLLIYKLVIVRLGEHPRDDLPWGAASAKNLGVGLLAGFAIMAASVGIAAALGLYRIIGPGDAFRLVLELVGVAIMPGFMEELFFRGILFRWIEEFGGSWAALVLTSAFFGIAHIFNPNATWFSSLAIAMEAGILLGGTYMLTRNLWLPMGLHAGWNFTQGEIFDVPVSGVDEHGLVQAKLSGPALLSGGQFGLEASVIALALATAVGVWFVWMAVKRDEVVQPLWVRRHQRDADAAPAAA